MLVTDLSIDILVSVAWKYDESWTGGIRTIIDCFDSEALWEENETTNIVSIRSLLFLNPEKFINAEVACERTPHSKAQIPKSSRQRKNW